MEGRGHQVDETVGGKDVRDFVPAKHLNETATDRRAGFWTSGCATTVAWRTPQLEEPDAGMPHVRICGRPGRVTAWVYPTQWALYEPLIIAEPVSRFSARQRSSRIHFGAFHERNEGVRESIVHKGENAARDTR